MGTVPLIYLHKRSVAHYEERPKWLTRLLECVVRRSTCGKMARSWRRNREVREGLPDEPEFTLTDGFVTTIRRKPELAFKAVGEQVEAPSRH